MTERQRAEDVAATFTAILMLSAILLQRFAIPVGDQFISLVGPLGLAAAGWAMLAGGLVLDPRRFAIFLLLVFVAAVSTAFAVAASPPMLPPVSWTSVAHFLGLTAFATLGFARALPERRFFGIIQSALTLCAGLGLAQFAAQFVLGQGMPGLFTFAGVLPDAILVPGYNTVIPASDGGALLKSNGLTLVEPSVFAQYMALGLIIEIAVFRRLSHLLLFPVALVASVSGTGWIVLGVFLLRVALGQRNGLLLAGATALVLGLALGILAFALPDVFAAFAERADEFRRIGTSGHARFVTPYWLLDFAMERTSWAPFLGLGASTAERLPVTYENTANVPVKLAIEYGFPAVAIYLALYLVAERTPRQSLLLPALLFLVLFAGGYQQFPPVLFPVLLIAAVARLRPAEKGAVEMEGEGTNPGEAIPAAAEPAR
ncbi:hypothetical protein VQH23_24600 [Pararoseomonas sp. SCSIO 73927]|uniref:hypothetical protein n=1 Tax=Pararoseomonas sp. SCSIO 73927 TaxID=3114537 RepID=UPI0030D24ABE